MSTPSVTIAHDGAETTASLVVDGRLVRLHGRAPVPEADRLLAPLLDTTVSPPSLIVVIGLGLGYVLDALEARAFDGRVLALEIEPATLDAMRARRSWTEWEAGGRLRVAPGPGFDGLDEARDWFESLHALPPVVVHPVLARERPGDVERARAAVTQLWFSARANADARATQAPLYLRNTLLNAHGLASETPSDVLDGAWRGGTVIVAAAGPSLDDAIPALRGLADRAVLIAVDTAARPLLGSGISPDVIVALDPTGTNGRHLIDLPPAGRAPYLVAEGSVDPIAVRQFTGRTYFFRVADHEPWPWLESHGLRAGRLRAWGSVLTSAVDLALRGGAARVIFVGADLAFTGGLPYCRGTTFERDWHDLVARGASLPSLWAESIRRWETVTTPDVTGGTTLTARHLLAFRDWIVETSMASPSCDFVNATPAGVLAGGRLTIDTLDGALARATTDTAAAARRRLQASHRRAPRAEADALRAEARTLWQAFVDDVPLAPLPSWSAFIGAPLDRRSTGMGLAALAGLAPAVPGATAPAIADVDVRLTHPGLGDADLEWLTALQSDGPLDVLRLNGDESEAALNQALDRLRTGEALAVIDDTVPAHGIALRRLLIEATARRGLWLEDGRYRDWGSRVFVVRHTPPVEAFDTHGRLGAHDSSLAHRVVGEIVERYRPSSVFDACGLSPVWQEALTRHGVAVVGAGHAETGAVPRSDLALLLFGTDRVSLAEAHHRFDMAVASSDRVLFAAVPRAHGPVTPAQAQPFETWGRAFAERGYALGDDWRRRVEAATGLATWFDLLLAFERVAPKGERLPDGAIAALAGLVGRIQEQFEAIVRLHVNDHHRRQTLTAAQLPGPDDATVVVPLPPERLRAGADGGAVAEFRSAFTQHWVAGHPTTLRVREGDVDLPRVAIDGRGGWRVVDGALALKSLDDTDVRLNGREYSILLPPDLARLELSGPATAVAPPLPV